MVPNKQTNSNESICTHKPFQILHFVLLEQLTMHSKMCNLQINQVIRYTCIIP